MNLTQRAILDLTMQAIALSGRPGSTRPYVVRPQAVVGAGADLAAPPLIFQEEGVVLALQAQEESATAVKYARMAVRVQMGDRDLFTDGQGGAFASFLGLCPPGQPYFPLMLPISPQVPWTFTFRNRDATGSTPEIILGFIAYADLRRVGG